MMGVSVLISRTAGFFRLVLGNLAWLRVLQSKNRPVTGAVNVSKKGGTPRSLAKLMQIIPMITRVYGRYIKILKQQTSLGHHLPGFMALFESPGGELRGWAPASLVPGFGNSSLAHRSDRNNSPFGMKIGLKKRRIGWTIG